MDKGETGSSEASDPSQQFGVFRLEADGSLFRGQTPIHLPPSELAALRLLLAHAGQIVTPVQLRRAIWGDRTVSAGSLSACIASLHARLQPHASIETVYKRGYRISTEVRAPAAAHFHSLPRLAILPFASEFGVPEYLGAAMAEEAGDQLMRARHPAAVVLAQDSVSTLARRGLTPKQVGSMLEADLVLTGTVRALPTHYRLVAAMLRASDGAELWMEDMLVERTRLLMLQRELADRVTIRLQEGSLSITAEESPDEQQDDPSHREAWEIYQQAHQEWQTFERHHMQDALRRLERAIELDPLLIPARVDLANLCVTQSTFGFMSPAVAADTVKHAASSIPDVAQPAEAILPMLGWINFHVDRDLPAAMRAFSLSAHLLHDPWITRARVMFALSRHRMDEAIEILRAALRLDPWSPWLNARLGWALHLAGQVSESVSQAEYVLKQFPEQIAGDLYGTVILAYNGQGSRAAKFSQDLAQRRPFSDFVMAVHAYALACAGREAEARVLLERLQWLGQERYVLRSFTAAVYVALGENDAALEQLRTADRERCPWFFQTLADLRLKPLHGHPEFKAMQNILVEMEASAAREAQPE
jgi:DNA-binding winged helix-turn-helix (wHTH) protein/predicted Zn-dependent protease